MNSSSVNLSVNPAQHLRMDWMMKSSNRKTTRTSPNMKYSLQKMKHMTMRLNYNDTYRMLCLIQLWIELFMEFLLQPKPEPEPGQARARPDSEPTKSLACISLIISQVDWYCISFAVTPIHLFNATAGPDQYCHLANHPDCPALAVDLHPTDHFDLCKITSLFHSIPSSLLHMVLTLYHR